MNPGLRHDQKPGAVRRAAQRLMDAGAPTCVRCRGLIVPETRRDGQIAEWCPACGHERLVPRMYALGIVPEEAKRSRAAENAKAKANRAAAAAAALEELGT